MFLQDLHQSTGEADEMTQDEQLHRIETELQLHRMEAKLQEVAERQSLARFDNVMFLAYPFVIATSTLLGSMLWNYEALEKLWIFGLPLRDSLIALIGFLVIGAVLSFFGFLLAHMRDNMHGRVVAYSRFLLLCGTLPISFAVLPASLSLLAGLGKLNVPPLLSNEIMAAPIVFSAGSLWIVLISRMCLRLLGWFEQNVPTRFASVRDSDRFYRNWSYTFLIGAKVGFVACWVIWSVVTALLLVRDGFSQVAFNNLLTLICLIAVGVAIWLEKE